MEQQGIIIDAIIEYKKKQTLHKYSWLLSEPANTRAARSTEARDTVRKLLERHQMTENKQADAHIRNDYRTQRPPTRQLSALLVQNTPDWTAPASLLVVEPLKQRDVRRFAAVRAADNRNALALASDDS